jgi:hypothetical protein
MAKDDFDNDMDLADNLDDDAAVDLGDLGDTGDAGDVDADTESFDDSSEVAGTRSSGGARANAKSAELEPAGGRASRPAAPKSKKAAMPKPKAKATGKVKAKKKAGPKKKAAAKKKAAPKKKKAGSKN